MVARPVLHGLLLVHEALVVVFVLEVNDVVYFVDLPPFHIWIAAQDRRRNRVRQVLVWRHFGASDRTFIQHVAAFLLSIHGHHHRRRLVEQVVACVTSCPLVLDVGLHVQ